jgi:hypothetical protein
VDVLWRAKGSKKENPKMPTLPKLASLKPEDNELEAMLILLLKVAYNISGADIEHVRQFGMGMFYEGCVTGAQAYVEALRTEVELRKSHFNAVCEVD